MSPRRQTLSARQLAVATHLVLLVACAGAPDRGPSIDAFHSSGPPPEDATGFAEWIEALPVDSVFPTGLVEAIQSPLPTAMDLVSICVAPSRTSIEIRWTSSRSGDVFLGSNLQFDDNWNPAAAESWPDDRLWARWERPDAQRTLHCGVAGRLGVRVTEEFDDGRRATLRRWVGDARELNPERTATCGELRAMIETSSDGDRPIAEVEHWGEPDGCLHVEGREPGTERLYAGYHCESPDGIGYGSSSINGELAESHTIIREPAGGVGPSGATSVAGRPWVSGTPAAGDPDAASFWTARFESGSAAPELSSSGTIRRFDDAETDAMLAFLAGAEAAGERRVGYTFAADCAAVSDAFVARFNPDAPRADEGAP